MIIYALNVVVNRIFRWSDFKAKLPRGVCHRFLKYRVIHDLDNFLDQTLYRILIRPLQELLGTYIISRDATPKKDLSNLLSTLAGFLFSIVVFWFSFRTKLEFVGSRLDTFLGNLHSYGTWNSLLYTLAVHCQHTSACAFNFTQFPLQSIRFFDLRANENCTVKRG